LAKFLYQKYKISTELRQHELAINVFSFNLNIKHYTACKAEVEKQESTFNLVVFFQQVYNFELFGRKV